MPGTLAAFSCVPTENKSPGLDILVPGFYCYILLHQDVPGKLNQD